MLQIFATTPQDMPLSAISDHAQRVESLGYDGLYLPDGIHDVFQLATLALNATQTLKVCTGILVAFPRSPMTTAVAAWDLQQFSQGRFELGLGTQIKQNIVQRYSSVWSSPLGQMREYIESLRAIFHSFQTGEKLNYVGDYYAFTRLQPFFNPGSIEHPHIPLFMGAVGPKMTELSGLVADGLICHPTHSQTDYLQAKTIPQIKHGLSRADHSQSVEKDKIFMLSLGSLLITTNKQADDYVQQREAQRQLLAFLFSTPAYRRSLEFKNWQAKGEQLQWLTQQGDWKKMAQIVDDDMLDYFVFSGDYQQLCTQLIGSYQPLKSSGLNLRINIPICENDDSQQEQALASFISQLRQTF